MIKINITQEDKNIKVEKFDSIFPQGWHTFLVESAELKESQEGNQYINLTVKCNDLNKKQWLSLFPASNKPFARKMLIDFMKIAEMDIDHIIQTGEFDEEDFCGTVFRGKIKNALKIVNGKKETYSSIVEFKGVNENTTPNNQAGQSPPQKAPAPIEDDETTPF